MKLKSRNITYTALLTAIIAIFSVISVPIGTVPISLGLLGVFIGAIALGPAISAMAVLVYLFIGAIGIPVFSGFQAGISVLVGPTGGYLFSYIAVAAITGICTRLASKKRRKSASFYNTCRLLSRASCLLHYRDFLLFTHYRHKASGGTFCLRFSVYSV